LVAFAPGCDEEPAQPPADDLTFCSIFDGYLDYIAKLAADDPLSAELGRHYAMGLPTRSAAEIIRYLGDLVYYQEKISGDQYHNRQVTLWYDEKCHNAETAMHSEDDCLLQDGGYLFRVLEDSDSGRVSVGYRGRKYSIGGSSPADHSLQVLAIANLAINLNKSAADIRTTPLVQFVP
jgi:hypothetical protein